MYCGKEEEIEISSPSSMEDEEENKTENDSNSLKSPTYRV